MSVSQHPWLEDEDPPFPPHDPNFPDVDPRTGEERETTEGPRTCQELIEFALHRASERVKECLAALHPSPNPVTREWIDSMYVIQEESIGLSLIDARMRRL